MMASINASLWEEGFLKNEIDLLVIGAGITGCSAAILWKERYPDKRVVVVDKGLVPEGASTRNAGFACMGSISEHLEDIRQTDKKTVLNRIVRRWNGLKMLRHRLGDKTIGYKACGGNEIFPDKDKTLYKNCISKLDRMNGRLYELMGEENVYEAGEYGGYPVIYNRLGGAVHTGKLMAAFHRLLSVREIPVWWNMRVKRADGTHIELENGCTLSSARVLAATNGFTNKLTGLPVLPARGVILKTAPIPDVAWKGTFSYNKGYVYFRDFDDGSMLIGGARDVDKDTESTDEFGINPKIRQWLIGFADNVLRLPSNWEIEREWSGIMGFTPDKEPLITQTDSGLYVAAGLSGMGVAIGMDVAREVVEMMV